MVRKRDVALFAFASRVSKRANRTKRHRHRRHGNGADGLSREVGHTQRKHSRDETREQAFAQMLICGRIVLDRAGGRIRPICVQFPIIVE